MLYSEQETTIQFSRDSTHAYIYTSDTTIMTKLDKKIKDHGGTWSLIDEIKDKDGKVVGKKYLTPKRKHRENFHDTGLGNKFFYMTPKAQATKEKQIN